MQTILLYIDPGSGSYILQMIIAAVLGISFFFKNFWLAIKTFYLVKDRVRMKKKIRQNNAAIKTIP
ncbi:MAG: hypothetical protein IPG38_05475 [Chitinophagaceae bacterium]|nr:hypothetical protein [Chitinophagaceae bacterium]